MERPDKSIDRQLRGADLVHHAAAGIEYDSHADWRIAGWGEVLDRLRLIVFYDDEVFLFQIRHQASLLIRNRSDNIDQLDIDLDLRDQDRSHACHHHQR